MDIERFQGALADIFKDIKRKKAKNLIIDFRQSEGGYPLNVITTFTYIASAPLKQQISSSVVTNNLPDKQYSQNLVSGYTYETFFEKYYQNAEQLENRWKSIIDENELLMVPNKKV